MIKGRSPFPFETIGLAVSFAPGLNSMVGEMKRMCTLHNAMAVFIHVGKKTGDKLRELSLLLSVNGFHDGNSRIYWEQGDIQNCILRLCKHEVVDLLLIGASEKENFRKPVGKIARGIATKAKCSVLIYTGYSSDIIKNIVVNGVDHKKTELTISTALYIAEKEKSSTVFVVEDRETSSFMETTGGFSQSTMQKGAYHFQSTIEKSDVKMKFISLAGEQCPTVSEYAFKNNSDLLITNSSEHHLLIFDRISGEDGIDAMLNNISCSLLIVHSRPS